MELVAHPGDVKREFLLEAFEKALPDVAEGSHVVGKDPQFHGHTAPPCGRGQSNTHYGHKPCGFYCTYCTVRGTCSTADCLTCHRRMAQASPLRKRGERHSRRACGGRSDTMRRPYLTDAVMVSFSSWGVVSHERLYVNVSSSSPLRSALNRNR